MKLDEDLKLEMVKDPKYAKARECTKEILEALNKKEWYETLFCEEGENDFIKRYLLFKAQGKLNCGFDCDCTQVVKDFFYQKFHYQGEYFDTLISMQYIWGMMLRICWKDDKEQIAFPETSKEYQFFHEKYGNKKDYQRNIEIPRISEAQKFIYELQHLEEIKEALGPDLYGKFEELAHYYHTIGNISPCPGNRFNRSQRTLRRLL